MTETLFPQRSRCKKCRKGLGHDGAPVLMGLYCSCACAGMPAPSLSADHPTTPRECKTKRDDAWVFKRRYRSIAEIPDKVLGDPATSTYWCKHCGHMHVGRTLVEMRPEQNRGLRSRADVAEVLAKARGKATLREVGAAAGIRPVRIKEWEDASFDTPSVTALFALLRIYRMEIAALFGPTSPVLAR